MKPRVLLVDDDPNVVASLRRILRRLGFEVRVACSGDEALDALAGGPVDVVVTDQTMPGMDGLTLLDQARKRFPGVARIMLTGVVDQDMEDRARLQGDVFRLYAKPVDAQELAEGIREAAARDGAA